MSRSPEAKERDRLAAIARRAARKAGRPALVGVPQSLREAVIGEPIPQALREAVATPAPKVRHAKQGPKKPLTEASQRLAKPHGGARKGAGAPTGATVRMRVITFKGTQRHYDAFHAAGAGAWLRGVLDAGVAAKHIKVPK